MRLHPQTSSESVSRMKRIKENSRGMIRKSINTLMCGFKKQNQKTLHDFHRQTDTVNIQAKVSEESSFAMIIEVFLE
jgi:hypothetical protein